MQQLQANHIRSLSREEIEQIDGGALPLIPLAIAFGKGFGVGAAIATGAVTVADALGLVDVF